MSIEVVIAAAIILAFGLAGVTMINTKGSQLMSNGMNKLEGLGIFGESPGTGGNTLFDSTWYHDSLGITEGDVNPVSDFTLVLNANGTSYTISAYNNTEDKTVVIPKFHSDGKIINTIGAYSFQNKGLTSVALHDAITLIGDYAFEGNALEQLYLPESISLSNKKSNIIFTSSVGGNESTGFTIGKHAFANNNLTDVKLSNGLVEIGDSAFENNNLTTILIPQTTKSLGSKAFFSNQINEVVLPSLLTKMGDYSFKDNVLTAVTFEGNLPTILGTDIFVANDGLVLRTVAVPSGQLNAFRTAATLLGVQTYAIYDPAIPYDPKAYDGTWYDASLNIKESDINHASDFTYTYNNTLAGWTITGYTNTTDKTVVIPKYHPDGRAVVEIGSNALKSKALLSVAIPNSVKTLGASSFQYNQLISVVVPGGVTSINNYAFSDNKLTSITLSNSVKTIGNFAFYYNLISSVTIPGSVTSIGTSAFNTNRLVDIVIPDSVITIGASAFKNNILVSAIIGNGTTSVGHEAFLNNKLAAVTIKNNATTIGAAAFNQNLLPQTDAYFYRDRNGSTSLVSYGGEADSVVIPEGTTVVSSNAFSNSGITSVNIPNSVTDIGYSAFYNNLITAIVIPDSVTTIVENAFAYNNITSLNIPDSVITLEPAAFQNNRLTSVRFFGGNPSTSDNGEIFKNNDTLSIGSILVPSIYLTDYRFYSLTMFGIPENYFTGY